MNVTPDGKKVNTKTARMNRELDSADAALVGNDELLAAILSGSGDCIKILDLDGKLQFMSDGGKRVMEVDDFGAVKGCPWPDFWRDEGNAAAKAAIEVAKSGKVAQFFGAADTAKGNPKFWDVRVMPVWGADGKPSHLLSISTDITEARVAKDTAAKLFEDAKDAAIREAETMRRLLQDAPSFMCVLEGPDHIFKITNNAYLQLVNFRDLVGLPVREALPELEGQMFFDLLDRVYSTGEPFVGRGVPIRLQRGRDGPYEEAFLNYMYQPVFDVAGNVTGIFIEGSDVTDLKKVEIELLEKDLQLQLALEAAGIGVWESTVAGDTFINIREDDRAAYLLGRDLSANPEFDLFVKRVHPEDRLRIGESAKRALDPNGNGILDVEYRIINSEGVTQRWIHARAKTVVVNDATRFVGTVRDVSERKAAEDQQRMISGELQHRIKNTLAMVSAIASQTLKGGAISGQLEVFHGRLHTLGHAHDLLTGNAQDQGDIRTVIETALAPHQAGHGQIEIGGPDIPLSPKQTLALALAVHELATNAMKYGALSRPAGKVNVRWTEDAPSASGPVFQLVWTESEGPIVSKPTRTGFGTKLVSRVLAAELNGEVTSDYRPEGLVCTLISRVRLGGG